ncbi:hypothetical protein C0992_011653 [Termitomyces sp. T32_za158]|nr:hypothetical protein C0992_011653 [Termitomyces sp. T32_za158]
MSRSTAPTSAQKRPLSPESQDRAPSVKKKQRMLDELHQEFDRKMEKHLPKIKDGSIREVIHQVWATAAIEKEFQYVWDDLDNNDYLDNPEVKGLIDQCISTNRWKDLREHGTSIHSITLGLDYLSPETDSSEAESDFESKAESEDVTLFEATEKSWVYPFIGQASEVLKQTVMFYAKSAAGGGCSARAIPIVQSSGTGKSRMVDQLAKDMLVIPLNLRPPQSRGFPPRDPEIQSYLSVSGTENNVKQKWLSFLSAVFRYTKNYLETIDDKLREIPDSPLKEPLAAKFRFLMSYGLSFGSPGKHRIEFYHTILSMVRSQKSSTDDLKTSLLQNCRDLTSYAENKGYGAVVLAFDEVCGLSIPLYNAAGKNVFYCLQKVLTYIRDDRRLVSLFLSTAGRVPQYTRLDPPPPTHLNPSMRSMKSDIRLIPPFTEVGFDHLAIGLVEKNKHLLSEMVTDHWMCHFGRPLFGTRYKAGTSADRLEIVEFAALKLLGGRSGDNFELSDGDIIALLATRLSLRFHRMTLASRRAEVEQMEYHMRICLAIEGRNETAITISPSEPILAEGASLVIYERNLNQAELLKTVLSGSSIDKGDRKKTVASLLFILARDAVVNDDDLRRSIKLTAWLQALLHLDTPGLVVEKSKEDEGQAYETASTDEPRFQHVLDGYPRRVRHDKDNISLKDCFQHAKLHFNHFIRIEDASSMNRNFLHMVIARSAAILCQTDQNGVHVVIPFVIDARKPVGPDNVSAILCQVKSSPRFITPAIRYFFDDKMDPFEFGIFNPPDKQDPVPLIRMVLALRSPVSGVTLVSPERCNPPGRNTQRSPAVGPERKPYKYTAYDIWCARACSSTFKVIKPRENTIYESLLLAENTIPDVYSSNRGDEATKATVTSLRKSANPAVNAKDPDHCRFGKIDPQ